MQASMRPERTDAAAAVTDPLVHSAQHGRPTVSELFTSVPQRQVTDKVSWTSKCCVRRAEGAHQLR